MVSPVRAVLSTYRLPWNYHEILPGCFACHSHFRVGRRLLRGYHRSSPADEVLLVVNSTEASLSIVPVESPGTGVTVPPRTTSTPVNVAARDGIAIVPLGLDNSAAIVDLRAAQVVNTIGLPAGLRGDRCRSSTTRSPMSPIPI